MGCVHAAKVPIGGVGKSRGMDIREIASSVGLPLAAAALGSVATASGTTTRWYQELTKPAIQPPPIVFPIAWSVLYTHCAIASAMAQDHMDEGSAKAYRRKLGQHGAERRLVLVLPTS